MKKQRPKQTLFERLQTARETIGLGEEATMDEIRHAFHDAIRRWHPDKAGDSTGGPSRRKIEGDTRRIPDHHGLLRRLQDIVFPRNGQPVPTFRRVMVGTIWPRPDVGRVKVNTVIIQHVLSRKNSISMMIEGN
jgi:hypothetical protein